ncbi:MAG: RNA-binding protein [Candidatus Nanoarchaeia archaeon]|nr:RNA-binding protein [Candidatus Nanoarchaeia archaeon]MDD5357623.1 RNA-binding protein [Candidatus Nanoarchaeia archaeon]MDD5588542.1 RNA-binding protein [Candidatus Nanoarchaeia archaeon]
MKLHVGNLPFAVGEEELKALFAEYNPEEVTLIKDKFSGRSKGFGFVTISDDEVANKAVSELNGKDMQGRELKVSEARPMEERPERPRRSFGDRGGGRSFGGGSSRGGGSFNSRRRF